MNWSEFYIIPAWKFSFLCEQLLLTTTLINAQEGLLCLRDFAVKALSCCDLIKVNQCDDAGTSHITRYCSLLEDFFLASI